MGVTTVTRNYQVTIPKDVRDMKGIRIGDKLVFSIEGGRIEMFKLKKEIAEKAFGSWKGIIKESGVAYARNIRKEWERRERRLGT